MRVVAVLVVIVGLVAGEGTCPAENNINEDWSKGTDMFGENGECKDVSSSCGDCPGMCTDSDYSHWMEKNCAKTCGICTDLPVSSSGTTCWTYCQGYSAADVLETVDYTTTNDCRDRCLENSQCIGVHTTEYYKTPKYCVLAKSGSLGSMSYYFGATRECIEENSDDNCYDGWSGCSSYSGACTSSCPYWKRLMSSMCMETCNFCSDDDNTDNSDDGSDDNSDDHDDHECTWITITGKKVKGSPLNEDYMTLEEGKVYCEEQGDSCAGLSCKGTSKCSAMASISSKKNHAKYDTYKKD